MYTKTLNGIKATASCPRDFSQILLNFNLFSLCLMPGSRYGQDSPFSSGQRWIQVLWSKSGMSLQRRCRHSQVHTCKHTGGGTHTVSFSDLPCQAKTTLRETQEKRGQWPLNSSSNHEEEAEWGRTENQKKKKEKKRKSGILLCKQYIPPPGLTNGQVGK